MKKIAAVLVVVVMIAGLASLAFAADMKGTIKSVDAKAHSVVLSVDGGKDETLKADKSVDLGKIKAGDKVEVAVDHGTIKSMKAAAAAAAPAKKAPVGC